MKFVYFTHSLRSCWNHGNAHFVRGVVRALSDLGHEVDVCEPEGAWSVEQLVADQGQCALERFGSDFPDLRSHTYRPEDADRLLGGADVVIVHEWTDPAVVARLGELRRKGASFQLFFHDTHHRAVSDPASIPRTALEDYDGILAFGESLSEVYRRWGFTAFTWHEAADTSHFYPRPPQNPEGVVWIGNWGDDERTAELETFLFQPVQAEGLPLTIRGVRYPPEALRRLEAMGARYGGWIANADAPSLYARHRMTVHVPRGFYVDRLPGIPTIRVFEALACGIPLISAWWPDEEGLFNEDDFLVARTGEEMRTHLSALNEDAALREQLAGQGRETILARHSCAHRAEELLDIVGASNASLATERRSA